MPLANLQALAARLTAAALLLAGSAAHGQQAEDIEYAEHLPLVDQSLLLDVIAHGDGYVAVGERGHVLLSGDGLEWNQAEVVPTRATLTTVASADGRLWAAGHQGVIITSGDGGRTWTRQLYDPERGQPIMDLHFFDPSSGLAIGAYGLMLVTADGGANWDDHYVSDEEWHLNRLLDFGDGRLLIAGEAGFAYRSTDNGETWEVLELPYPGSMFGIVGAGDGCAVLYGLRGTVLETCDFGDSFEELDTGTESSLMGATRSNGGLLLVGKGGLVLERAADGRFTQRFMPAGEDLSAILPRGDGTFIVVGVDGVRTWPAAEDAE